MFVTKKEPHPMLRCVLRCMETDLMGIKRHLKGTHNATCELFRKSPLPLKLNKNFKIGKWTNTDRYVCVCIYIPQ